MHFYRFLTVERYNTPAQVIPNSVKYTYCITQISCKSDINSEIIHCPMLQRPVWQRRFDIYRLAATGQYLTRRAAFNLTQLWQVIHIVAARRDCRNRSRRKFRLHSNRVYAVAVKAVIDRFHNLQEFWNSPDGKSGVNRGQWLFLIESPDVELVNR